MIGANQTRGLGRQRAGVLDGLRFVKHAVIEALLFELQRVAPERAVGGKDRVVVVEVIAGLQASAAGVIEHAQQRRKARRLLLPMEHERARRHDQRRARPVFVTRRAQLAARFEERQDLNGFAQSHVIGQTAAKSEAPEKMQPAQAVALIIAQYAVKLRGRASRLHAAKSLDFPARALEQRITADLRLLGDQGIEQPDLRPAEAQAIATDAAETGQQAILRQPLFWNDAQRAIVEQNGALSVSDRAQQLRQGQARVAESRAAFELEPVHARVDGHGQRARRAVKIALGFDAPAFGRERSNHFGQMRRRQLQLVSLPDVAAKSQFA